MARLTNLIRKAQYEARDLRELQQIASRAVPRKLGLPTTWRDRDSGVSINGRETPVVTPTGREVQIFGDQGAKVCGGCKHFNLEAGRKKMIDEQFPDRLVHEMEWKLHHLGVPPDSLAACDMDDTMLTTIVSKACPQYSPAPGKEFKL